MSKRRGACGPLALATDADRPGLHTARKLRHRTSSEQEKDWILAYLTMAQEVLHRELAVGHCASVP